MKLTETHGDSGPGAVPGAGAAMQTHRRRRDFETPAGFRLPLLEHFGDP